MRARWKVAPEPVLFGAVFVLAVAIAVELLRPTAAGAVGFDTAASVLHFDRIVAGRHLESFVTATPKPLLTVVDGSLMALFDDWRVVAWAAIAAFAATAAAAAWLAARTAGLVGGVAAGALVVASGRLLSDVAIAYALPWAAALSLVAALAVSGPRRHPVLAGLALAGATLARLEVVAITGAAILAVVAIEIAARRRREQPDRSWWWVALGLAAFPIMCLHDLLLTGDPLFWLSVSAVFSSQAPGAVLSPIGVMRLIAGLLASEPVVAALAGVGVVWLWRARRFALAVGVAGSTLGVAALLVLIAVRGTYVSDRYLGAIDLGLRFAAAFGVGAVATGASAVLRRSSATLTPRAVRLAATALAIAVLSVATWQPGFLRPDVRLDARTAQQEARHLDSILPVVRCAIAALPGGIPMPPATVALASQTPEMIAVLGPVLLRPRLAHDLGIPVGAVASIAAAQLDPASFLPVGTIAIHDRLSDRPAAAFAALEVDAPRPVGDVTLTALVSDPDSGVWVDWIGRAGGPEPPIRCGRPG
ncbi:MAG TPA: hypothetical protein VIK65_07525 [Candidatus Limnocylindrales bacterium]